MESIDIGGQLRQLQDRPAYNKNPGQPQYTKRRTVTSAIGEFHRLPPEFLPAFLNPRAIRVFALIFSEHLRQIPDPAKIAILVRFIFAFLYTCIHIIHARTWYCFSPHQLARILIVTSRTEMLFLWQNFILKISYTPISKNPAKIRMLSSRRKSQNTPRIKYGHTRSRHSKETCSHRQQIRQPAPALKQNREGRKADTMHRAPIHTAEKATPRRVDPLTLSNNAGRTAPSLRPSAMQKYSCKASQDAQSHFYKWTERTTAQQIKRPRTPHNAPRIAGTLTAWTHSTKPHRTP